MTTKTIEIRGFRKPTKGMKVLVDHSITPIELARSRYHKLYEAKCVRDAEKLEKLMDKRDYLFELKQFIKGAL